jgi:hypothetical protein
VRTTARRKVELDRGSVGKIVWTDRLSRIRMRSYYPVSEETDPMATAIMDEGRALIAPLQ